MSEENKKIIREMVEDLKHLDEDSLRLVKVGAEMLRARDALDKKQKPPEEPDLKAATA